MAAHAREGTAREFLALSKKQSLLAPDGQFTPDKQACDAKVNPLLRRRHAFLIAGEETEPKARLLLLDGGKTAWFAMPVMKDDEYASALVEKAVDIARRWGAEEIAGPVSPDGSGFGIGAALPGSFAHSAPWHPERDDGLTAALARSGMKAKKHLLELSLLIAGKQNPYRGAEKWAEERSEVRVKALGRGRRACEAAYAACKEEKARGYDAFEKIFARCGELAPGMETLVAFCEDKAAGWALLVKEQKGPCVPHKRKRPAAAQLWQKIGPQSKEREAALALPAGLSAEERASNGRSMRVLHMQILPGYRGSCCAAAMLDRAWQEAENFGAERVFVSTIDADNGASLRMARNAGATILADYALFSLGIAPVSAK